MASSSSSSCCESSCEALSVALSSVALNSKSAFGKTATAAGGAASPDPSSSAHRDPKPHFPQFLSPTSPSNDHNSHHPTNPLNGSSSNTTSLIWFRNDLRIHDNEALFRANTDSAFLIPIYCFDPRDFGKSASMGVDKTGPYRALFLIECVANLRENLRQRGSDLVLRIGKPEEEVVGMAKGAGASSVYAHQEVSHEEFEMEKTVQESLGKLGVEAKFVWGSTLFHRDDLPFQLEDMPSSYCTFRTKLRNVQVRPVLEAPKELKSLPSLSTLDVGALPTLQDLGLPSLPDGQDGDAAKEPTIHGGETEALRIIISIDALLMNSKDKEVHHDVGTSFGINPAWNVSPWLATGCLSPRRMLHELTEKYSRAGMRVFDEGFEHHVLDCLLVELLWRDFFRFVTRKYVSQ
ncbi:hypothetical protein O6H91_02G085800 [Diphasiastrum complanatum]|uniref:Uncharacterized protein n=3 Tax=Diphasiastrum complanatum TaxID=34168 RepID=A0ACC2EHV0_DIPCM|nr:hypothetical protein O6H91_02G085800 [Diphasiastrum complanatum]